MKLSKELLKEIYNSVDENLKAKIENEVPKMKARLEVGKWYKHNKFLLYAIDDTHWYGFDHGAHWEDNVSYTNLLHDNYLQLATPEEVKTALVNEAKRRYNGKKVKCNHSRNNQVNFNDYEKIELSFDNCLRLYTDRNCICIMDYDGTWATIINEPTQKELLQKQVDELKRQIDLL
jgi:7-keto-8-aminopelargonate synthetase-like enzyme